MTPRRLAVAALPAALALLIAAPARASGDACTPGWMLDFSSMPECANVAALTPGNDTRANLLLLLADRHATPASTAPATQPLLTLRDFRAAFSGPPATDAGLFASGEGSRCRSDGTGAKAFVAAVEAASSLSPDERKRLTDARARLMPQCEGGANAAGSNTPSSAAEAASGGASPQGHAFADYLHAAGAFYAGQFDEAAAGFDKLRSDPDPWLAETAAYMVARTAVNRMQESAFDEYGTFKGSAAVDQTAAHGAAASLDAYLKDHAAGRYAASARGLQRRVGWLAGWTEELASRYAALLAEPAATRGLDDAALADEIDSKLLPTLTPAMTRDPILLATLDLKAMRRAAPGEAQPQRPDLATQREAFATAPDLYAFLVAAAAFYGDGDAKPVIHDIPDDTRRRGGTNLWFSRQLLRGLALEAAGDRNARGFWAELLPGATQPLQSAATRLALALNEERHGDVDEAFKAGSPVTDPAMRAILLIHDAGPDLLRARAIDPAAAARERQIALFTLLSKELTRGVYAGFLADAARVPADAPKDGLVVIDPLGDEGNDAVPLGLFARGETAGDIGCPDLHATVAHLASNPKGVRDHLCLAEWIRLNGFDPDNEATLLTKHDLGFGPSAFPGTPLTRTSIYHAVMAERGASADDKAFALYRAVKCYEPTGNNGCGGPDVPKAERRRWHDALKRDYPRSRWAKQLHYWW